MKVSVSILNCSDRIKAVKEINNTDSDYLHIDVMDGAFVLNKQFSVKEICKIGDLSKKKLDVHLMVDNPLSYIKKISLLNIEYITIHIEIKKKLDSIIDEIKKRGFKVGISLKPNTNIEEIDPYLDKIDLVLLMSVEPGKGGQQFMPSVVDKIRLLKEKKPNLIIEVDGGINEDNISLLKDADIIVAGTYITSNDNYQERINKLR